MIVESKPFVITVWVVVLAVLLFKKWTLHRHRNINVRFKSDDLDFARYNCNQNKSPHG